MNKTLTVRLDRAQDEALTGRARALGKTKSQIVRQLIKQGLEEQPLGQRIGHLRGRFDLPSPKSGWPRRLKERNWR